jgi:predicted nucleic acid-binding protein
MYLLDVNVLVAFGVSHHQLHRRVSSWVAGGQYSRLLTCSIVELGFVRVTAQTPPYGLNVAQAVALLSTMKSRRGLAISLIEDAQDVSGLPAWVNSGKQTTDGHLVELAKAHGATLATLDNRIPGAFVIP